MTGTWPGLHLLAQGSRENTIFALYCFASFCCILIGAGAHSMLLSRLVAAFRVLRTVFATFFFGYLGLRHAFVGNPSTVSNTGVGGWVWARISRDDLRVLKGAIKEDDRFGEVCDVDPPLLYLGVLVLHRSFSSDMLGKKEVLAA